MELSIIIPAFNEEKRLGSSLEKIRDHFRDKSYELEVILVDDGSRDKTVSIAENCLLAKESILKIYKNDENRGKGYSVRKGIKEAKGELILFTDADLSTPIGELQKLRSFIDDGYDMAIGSRSLKDSQVKIPQPFYRVLMGKTFNFMVRAIILRGFIDTQCGFKLLKRDCIKSILPDMKIDGFSFDVEMLYLASKKGCRIKEVPVIWEDYKGSKVNPLFDSAKMFMDLLYIKALHLKNK